MSKEDINLPKTSFSMKANLPNKEPEILKIWEKMNLFKKFDWQITYLINPLISVRICPTPLGYLQYDH